MKIFWTQTKSFIFITCLPSLRPQISAMSSFMRVIHLAQALLSGYGAFHSYKAIVNLQTYEATTKKLARWSDEVGKQLHKTRTTQATAALTVRPTQTSFSSCFNGMT